MTSPAAVNTIHYTHCIHIIYTKTLVFDTLCCKNILVVCVNQKIKNMKYILQRIIIVVVCVNQKIKNMKYILQRIIITMSTFCTHGFKV